MGWCHEFGPQIAETCDHPMTAHADRCECEICGTVCTGRFAGCSSVWARGPHEVAVDAPHLGRLENGELDLTAPANGDGSNGRWHLPLEPMMATSSGTSTIVAAAPAADVAEIEPETVTVDEALVFEAPDVTARFAVAQLEELNERVATLVEGTIEKTDSTLTKVHQELARITSMREVDLTEQAAAIFGAVQAGAEALESFASVVDAVTADLRTILADSLAAIGGTDGLAAWVAESASELTGIREEFAGALNRIERDLAVMRRRPTASITSVPEQVNMKLTDDQMTFIVEAVTEAVVSALTTPVDQRAPRRR